MTTPDQNLFKDDPTTPETPADPIKNYLEELVGEGKKFKTPEDLARGKAASDAFIERLQSELKGLRDDLNSRLRLEEIVDKIASASAPKSPSSEHQPKAPEPDDTDKTGSITPDQIEDLVAKTMSKAEKARQRESNLALVEAKLQEAFGPTFRRTIKEQARKLNLGESFLNELAAEQPQAFLKLLDVNTKAEPDSAAVSLPRSDVSSEGMHFRPATGIKRKSYYDDIRKKDPNRYWSVSVQNEMHKQAHAQGESFFDS